MTSLHSLHLMSPVAPTGSLELHGLTSRTNLIGPITSQVSPPLYKLISVVSLPNRYVT